MTAKPHSAPAGDEPVQVFRQFAWHLAGTLAAAKATPAGRSRPPKGPAKR
jgi:hypothetical protein